MLVFKFILVALFSLLVFMIFIKEALKEIKHQFFFVKTSVCNDGPSPNIFPSWILRYITSGANSLMQELPAELPGSIFESLYKQVRL